MDALDPKLYNPDGTMTARGLEVWRREWTRAAYAADYREEHGGGSDPIEAR